MAVTADSVVVRLEADTAGYLRDISDADKKFTTAMSHINSQAPRVGQAVKGLGGDVGNLSAQFNDIGVQLAGGQSPLLIALQQGAQLSEVLNRTANPVRALGAAFLSVVSPVSLATIGIIALGGVAIQYLGTLLGDGKSATEVLKEQNDLIQRVAENWGDAVPALQAYVAELRKAGEVADLGKASEIAAKQQFEELLPVIDELNAAFDILVQTSGMGADEGKALTDAYSNLTDKMRDGTAEAADFTNLLDALESSSVGNTGAAQGFAEAMQGLAASFFSAANAASAFRKESEAALQMQGPDATPFFEGQDYIAEQERRNSLTSDQLALENEIARVKAEASRADAFITEEKALEIAQGRLNAEERRSAVIAANNAATKSGASAANDAERERQAVLDLIDALMFEQSLVGMTTAEKAVMNALRRAGAAATEEEALAIEELIETTYAQQDAIRASEQAMQQFQQLGTQALTGFISDLREGKSAAEALSNVFDNLANQLIQIAAQNLIGAAFGGMGGGGGIGNIFAGLFGGRRASGGPVQSGKAYLVGEKGPEPFIPHTSGTILPNSSLNGGGSGGAVEVRLSLDNDMLKAEIVSTSGRVAASAIGSYDRNLPATLAEKNLRYGSQTNA